MTDTEDRLRDALRAEASGVTPGEGWVTIESRLSEAVPRNRTRLLMAAAAATLAVVAAVAVIAQPEDKQTPVVTDPGPGAATTVTTEAVVVVPTGPPFMWPFDDTKPYETPEALADAFARDFLFMPDPTLSEYRPGDNNSGEIDVHPNPRARAGTTLLVRRTQSGWEVLTAMSDNLQLDAPEALDEITSPVTLRGRSVAFEGQVQVTLLRYGTSMQCAFPTDTCGSNPGVLANTHFTGNGTEMGPFETKLNYTPSPQPYALLVLWSASGENGTVVDATVRLVRLG
jgi:hypothetical protein